MGRGVLLVMLAGLVYLAGCTIPNPHLCRYNPAVCDGGLPGRGDGPPRPDLAELPPPDGAVPDGAMSGGDPKCCGPGCVVCEGSAKPVCDPMGHYCTCDSLSCGPNDSCSGGECTRSCNPLDFSACAGAPEGHKCLNAGVLSNHCGCGADGDCGTGSHCQGGVCVCGSTVCRSSQQCKDGTCQ